MRCWLVSLFLGSAMMLSAQQVHTLRALQLGRSLPLRDITLTAQMLDPELKKANKKQWGIMPDMKTGEEDWVPNLNAKPAGEDPLRALSMNKDMDVSVLPMQVVEGIGYSNVTPPDPVVEVGKNHVVHMVNSSSGVSVQIYDKEGGEVAGPFDLNSLWLQFGDSGLGDPIAMYDHEYDRWLLAEMGDKRNSILLAVSVTPDPYGAFDVYYVGTPTLPDYPKFGIWDNMVLISTNQYYNDSIPVYLLNRHELFSGAESVEVREVGIPKFFSNFQVCAPADWNSPIPPPPGSPACLLRVRDDAWDAGDDAVELWEVTVDWDTPEAVELSGPVEIFTASFDAEICQDGSIFDCVLQPNGQYISALERTIMNYPHYRNFGSHESIVLCFSVEVAPSLVGTRWVEMRRNPGGEWQLHQEGTISPDNDHRFMASVGMDGYGGILAAYTVLGDSTYNSLRYTGRRQSDPLGQMTIEEYTFAPGLNWANTNTRWGDYGSVSVDPIDHRTMWYVGEYMKSGGGGSWGTKIVAVQIHRDSVDVGVESISQPTQEDYFTDMQTIKAVIRNHGLTEQGNFQVGMKFGNAAPVFATVTQTLQPNDAVEVTFPGTFDMSGVGSYPVTCFTMLVNDANPLSDTLRETLVQYHLRETAIVGQLNPELTACSDDAHIRVLIQNNGFQNLNAIDVKWQNNGGNILNWHWTGSLSTHQRDTVLLPLSNTQIGENAFKVWLANPVNQPDIVPTNDTLHGQITLTEMGATAYLRLRTDKNPETITWQVMQYDSLIIASGGPFVDSFTWHTIPFCVHPDSCYKFILNKSNGQGNYFRQQGDFYILDAQQRALLVYDHTSFGAQKVMEFCGTFECRLDFEVTIAKTTDSTTNNGILFIEPIQNFGQTLYRLNDGDWQTGSVFENLPIGTYTVGVRDDNGCVTTKIVVVEACDLHVSYTITYPPGPGQNFGSVVITAGNGLAPYKYSKNGGQSFSTTNQFNNLGAQPYIFCVKDAENCRRCDSINLDTSTTIISGVEVIMSSPEVVIAPNPTTGVFRVDAWGFPLAQDIPVAIFDAQGRSITTTRLSLYDRHHAGMVAIADQPAGTYWLKIGAGERAVLRQVIKL